MKRVLRFFLDGFIKIMSISYPSYLILGILVSPIIFIVSGFSGLKECYFEHKDLSYSTYLSYKKSYWKNRGN